MIQSANNQFIKTLCIIVILFLFAANSLWAKISIMPLGDSITLGIGPSDLPENLNGYRRDLWNILNSSGYDVDFVGSSSNGTFVENQHEGHPGWRDDQIADSIYAFLNDNPANIILLHIGTNGLAESEIDVVKILNEINGYEDEKAVKIHVIIARIINRSCKTDDPPCAESVTTTTFNNNVANMVQSRIDAGDNLLHIVDMEVDAGLNYHLTTDNPPGDMADNLHPSHTGYAKMADKWFVDGLLAILPIAVAGTNQFVDEKTLVTLDGSGSVDPDGAHLDYFWKQQTTGTLVALSDSKAAKPTFTAPETGSNGETLTFDLTVTDADGFNNIDTISVHINDVLIPPEVDAGPDQIVKVGNMVTLNGSNSYDPDGTISSVQWEQVAGKNQVTLTTPTELITEFKAPAVDSDGDALKFKLTVKDNDDLVSSDTVTITVNISESPVANAGADKSATEGTTITLNGSNSYDPDGTIASVQWEQLSGSTQVDLTTPTDLITEFTAPAVDTEEDVLTFKLTVKDSDNLVSEDIVNVTVIPAAVSTASSNGGGSGGGGCFIQSVSN